MQFAERTKKVSIEEGVEIFDRVSQIFKQNEKIKNFDERRRLDDQVKQLEEAQEDLSLSQTDFTQRNNKMNKILKKFEKKLVCLKFYANVFCVCVSMCVFCSESCQKLSQSLSEHEKLFNENLKQISKSSQFFSKNQFPEAFKILEKGPFKKFHKNCKSLFSDEFLKQNNQEIDDAEKEITQMVENLTKQEKTLGGHVKMFDKQLGILVKNFWLTVFSLLRFFVFLEMSKSLQSSLEKF